MRLSRGWRNWLREDPPLFTLICGLGQIWSPLLLLFFSVSLILLRVVVGFSLIGLGSMRNSERLGFPTFAALWQREASLEEFDEEVEGWLPLLPEVSLPHLTGQMLADVVRRKGATAGSLDGWDGESSRSCLLPGFMALLLFFPRLRRLGSGPMVYWMPFFAMIPETDGDATPLGQRPLSFLPVVYRIWASACIGHLEDWFKSWVPESVFSAGGGRISVEAWYTSALDIEEVLSVATDSDVHLFVADVFKSFDTVDRRILDRVLSSLGLPGWFRHALFPVPCSC